MVSRSVGVRGRVDRGCGENETRRMQRTYKGYEVVEQRFAEFHMEADRRDRGQAR